MAFWKSFVGQYQVEMISSDISQMLISINQANIALQDIQILDDLRLCAVISRVAYGKLLNLLNKRGEELIVQKNLGLYWKIMGLKKRPIFVIGMLLLLYLSLFLPTRILFVEVTGNSALPDKYIIETAKNCGIDFWASRRQVRSEKMKNALLSAIPQLQWAGINTKGCVAVISVRERKEETVEQKKSLPNSIVAGRDGIIQELTVLAGTPLCKVGQGVKQGQVLVSGFTDCGLSIKVERADAEIMAYTYRNLEAVTPLNYQKRIHQVRKKTKFSLRIGKKLIKLWKDSGISDARCVKMYTEKYLTLPGGFRLPFALIQEETVFYDLAESKRDENAHSWLPAMTEEYISQHMIAGRILEKETDSFSGDGIYIHKGKYACLEMIGQIRYEENLTQNGI